MMMPEFGKYAVEILSSYGVSILVLAALVWQSLHRARRVRAALTAAEARARRKEKTA